MSSRQQIAEIEDALIARVQADAAVQEWLKEARTLGAHDITSDGDLVAPSGSVLFLAVSAELAARDAITRKTYDYPLSYQVFLTSSNLRGAGEEKKGFGLTVGAYGMLGDLMAALGGARLGNISGAATDPQVELAGWQLASFSAEGTVMMLQLRVRTEFSSG